MASGLCSISLMSDTSDRSALGSGNRPCTHASDEGSSAMAGASRDAVGRYLPDGARMRRGGDAERNAVTKHDGDVAFSL